MSFSWGQFEPNYVHHCSSFQSTQNIQIKKTIPSWGTLRGRSGCDIGPNWPSNFDKNRPADIWKSFRHQTKHYNHITSSKVMGCSVAIGRYFGGNERCVYCYLVWEIEFYNLLWKDNPYIKFQIADHSTSVFVLRQSIPWYICQVLKFNQLQTLRNHHKDVMISLD